MADPPGKSATEKVESRKTSTIKSNINQVCDTSICDKSAVTMQKSTSATATTTVSNVASKDPVDTSDDVNTRNLVSTLNDLQLDAGGKPVTTTPSTSEEDTVVVITPTDPTIFPWARLSGEIRNQIYRAYFDTFQEERKNVVNFEQTAPMFLNLLQADRKIRSEAAPIFYEEYLPFDCFNPSAWLGSGGTVLWRIQALSSFVALRDPHMRVSIRYLTDTGASEDWRVGIWVAKYISHAKGEPLLTDQSYTWRSVTSGSGTELDAGDAMIIARMSGASETTSSSGTKATTQQVQERLCSSKALWPSWTGAVSCTGADTPNNID
jgi:hypothetical protein